MHDAAGGVTRIGMTALPFFPWADDRRALEGLAARFLCRSRRVSRGLGDEVAAGASVFLAGHWTTDFTLTGDPSDHESASAHSETCSLGDGEPRHSAEERSTMNRANTS